MVRTIGVVVDKTWGFIPSHGFDFLCLFDDCEEKYLFLVDNYEYKRVDGVNVEHFNGTLFEMPEEEILRKNHTIGLYNILTSDRLEKPDFMPRVVREAKDVPMPYVSSLDKYIHEISS